MDMVNQKKTNIQYSIPISILKEGDNFIAYTPVLDLSTSGKTVAEVSRRFKEVVQIFFDELIEKGTLDKVLAGLGWRRIEKQWAPPMLVAHESRKFNIPFN
jgi:predicted RNase H-like HicB family nuclease